MFPLHTVYFKRRVFHQRFKVFSGSLLYIPLIHGVAGGHEGNNPYMENFSAAHAYADRQMKPKRIFFFFSLTAVLLLVGYGMSWLFWWNCVANTGKDITNKRFAVALESLNNAARIGKPFEWLDFRYVYTRYLIGSVYALDNQQELAQRVFGELEPLYGTSKEPYMPTKAELLFAYGSAYVSAYQPAKAAPLMMRALAALERVDRVKTRLGANILNTLGKLHRDQKLTAEALPYFEQALAVRRTVFGENSREVFTTMYDTGFNYHVAGDYKKAAEMFREADHLAGKLERRESAECRAAAKNALAAAYIQLGRKDDALQILENYAKSDKSGFAHTSASYTLGRLGQIFERQNRNDEAERFYQQAVWINDKIGQTFDPDFLEAEGRYEKMLERMGRSAEAATLHRRFRKTSH